MNIQELPSPLRLELRTEDRLTADLTGIAAELLSLILFDLDTHKQRRGSGTFRIIDAFMGRVCYEWSEEDLQQAGRYSLFIKREDGVAGPTEVYEFSLQK